MQRQRHSRRAAQAVWLAIACVSAACVSPKPPGLRVTKGETDVVFGATAEEQGPVRAERPEPDGVGLAGEVLAGDFELTDDGNPVPRRPPRRSPVPVVEPCPEAPPAAVPKANAEGEFIGLPTEGSYRWKRSGKARVTRGTQSVDQELSGFERRTVMNVMEVEGGFRFQVIQEDVRSGMLQRTTYRVRTVNAPVAAGLRQSTTQPRGLHLESIELLDPQTGQPLSTGSLRPNPTIRLAPYPIQQNVQFFTQAVDPTVGFMEAVGTVTKRTRVDACGELVDGWYVKMTWYFNTSQGSYAIEHDFAFAPQLGGILIFELRKDPRTNFRHDAAYSLAQLHPDPVS